MMQWLRILPLSSAKGKDMSDDLEEWVVLRGNPNYPRPVKDLTLPTPIGFVPVGLHAAVVAERDELRAALEWYGEQARLSRLVRSEGDIGRYSLAADGGKRARAALSKVKP